VVIDKPRSKKYQENEDDEETSHFFYKMAISSIFDHKGQCYDDYWRQDMFEGDLLHDDILDMLKHIARDALLVEIWPTKYEYFDRLTEKLIRTSSWISEDDAESVTLISKSTQEVLKTNFLRDLESLGYPVKRSPEFFSLEFEEDLTHSAYEMLEIHFSYGFCDITLEIIKYITEDDNSVILYSPKNLSDRLFNGLPLKQEKVWLLRTDTWDEVLALLSDLDLEDYILDFDIYLDFYPSHIRYYKRK
jgi:hypothetical protein